MEIVQWKPPRMGMLSVLYDDGRWWWCLKQKLIFANSKICRFVLPIADYSKKIATFTKNQSMPIVVCITSLRNTVIVWRPRCTPDNGLKIKTNHHEMQNSVSFTPERYTDFCTFSKKYLYFNSPLIWWVSCLGRPEHRHGLIDPSSSSNYVPTQIKPLTFLKCSSFPIFLIGINSLTWAISLVIERKLV